MSKQYRYNKHAPAVSVVYGCDINIGYATLKHDTRKGITGWALPGLAFTADANRAENIALKIHNMIASRGGLPRDWMAKRNQRPLPVVTYVEVTEL